LALARARRAQTARTLIEATAMSFADVAFAAGFASVRQFNETMAEVYAATPSQLRGNRRAPSVPTSRSSTPVRLPTPSSVGHLNMRLAVRTPYAGHALIAFLAARAVPGVEQAEVQAQGGAWYHRTLALPHGPGVVKLEADDVSEPGLTAFVRASFELHDLRDTSAAVERVRRLIDADCDPVAVGAVLRDDPVLADDLRRTPGLRVPGHVDGNEVAVRAVLGQQISVSAARTLAARLVEECGERIGNEPASVGPTKLFPSMQTLAGLNPEKLAMPRARGRALVVLCAALADGQVALDRSADRLDVRSQLLALPGIGPWTADYIAMRALGHPDVFLPTDVGVRHALAARGLTASRAEEIARRWRPWRSYALMYLWHSLNLTNEGA